MPPTDSLNQLYRDLGWKPLSAHWAKAEIVLGFLAAALGFIGGIKLAMLPETSTPVWLWMAPVLLITLGGYLALAGHRSHLYQSNNRLAAYLAEIIRSQSHQPEKTP
ncbi:MAG: hypothetical protein RMJ56_13405 [Gemmataceae bacterium]|nr:hypothetical protein [Gemmata sp.]MDW8198589.1 hypothetical protein [Gemmataceae bacterium]